MNASTYGQLLRTNGNIINSLQVGADGPKEEKLDVVKNERFMQLRHKIKPYFKILHRTPESDLEIALASEDEDLPSGLSLNEESILVEVEELIQKFENEYLLKKEEIRRLWQQTVMQWEEIENLEDHRLGYAIVHPTVIESLRNLNKSVIERSDERNARLAAIAADTVELRFHLRDIWATCHISDDEKTHFMEQFTTENFSEDVFEAHKAELKIWRAYQKKNQSLMDKVAKREQMWKELIDLENRADDPSRFVNRGASMLKDQNYLTSLRKNLPKVEEDILKLTSNFAAEYGRSFKIDGKEVPDIIRENWEHFREEKAKKKHARTHHVPTPAMGQPTPRKRQTMASCPTPAKRACAPQAQK